MWKDVVSLAVCCVLFVQMGLADAVLTAVRLKCSFLVCPKCLTFWTTLAWQLLHGQGVLASLTASFLLSYVALWLALLYDYLASTYNKAYESITHAGPAPGDDKDDPAEDSDASHAGGDVVSKVRKKNKIK